MVRTRLFVIATVTVLMTVTVLDASAKSWELDTSFSGDGRLRLTMLDALPSNDGFVVSEIGILGDKVYSSGLSNGTAKVASGFIVRTSADGTLDDSYGVDGVASWTVTAGNHDYDPQGYNFEVLPDGALIASYQSTNRLTVLRWTADGVLDSSFSSDGVRTFPLRAPGIPGGGGGEVQLTELAMDQVGRVVVAAEHNYFNTSAKANVRIYRMMPSGALDDRFSSDGFRRVSLERWDFVHDLAIDSQNRILIASASTPSFRDGITGHVIRLRQNGSADTSFSGNGVVRVGLRNRAVDDDSYPLEMGVADDVTTIAMSGGGTYGGARILENGMRDPNYGIHGVVGFTCNCSVHSADVSHGEIAVAGDLEADDEQLVATISRSGSRVSQGAVDLFPSADSEEISSVGMDGDAVFVGGGVQFSPSTAFIAKLR